VLAYLFWHRPADGIERAEYEQALARFHRSLAYRPPSGLLRSCAVRVSELPWQAPAEAPQPAYEDWYVVEDWAAIGVLEEAAVSRGHLTAHETIAKRSALLAGAVYRLLEGSAEPKLAAQATWISTAPLPGRERPSLQSLLADGIDPRSDGLWQRCLVLGPAPEYCVLAQEPPAGAAAGRLPAGWHARAVAREHVCDG
jgi:hypothetical protein